MVKIPKFLRTWENNFTFWITLVLGFIFLFTSLITNFDFFGEGAFPVYIQAIFLFPIGIFGLFGIDGGHPIFALFIPIFYIGLFFLARKAVKDPKFNVRILAIILFFLLLTAFGCTLQLGRI